MPWRARLALLATLLAFLGSTPVARADVGRSPDEIGHLPGNPTNGNVATGAAGGHRCARITRKSFTGTLVGQDGRYLNATIGFDIIDRQGRKIDVTTGCPVKHNAYGAIVQLNHYVSGDGAVKGSVQVDVHGRSQGKVTDSFAVLNLPANAVAAYAEAYVRRYNGSPCYSCSGNVDTHRYGFVNRNNLKPGAHGLRLIAPLTASAGGATGTIRVTITHGHVHSVLAFSAVRDGSVREQGWGVGHPNGQDKNVWIVDALASNQPYTVLVEFTRSAFLSPVVERVRVVVKARRINGAIASICCTQ